jgi:hypothetical protein
MHDPRLALKEKIRSVLSKRIVDELPIDVLTNTLQRFEGKLCNARLESAVREGLQPYGSNAVCVITKEGWNGARLDITIWLKSYDKRTVLKLAPTSDQTTTRVNMEWIRENNPYYFGGVQTNNKRYNAFMDDEDRMDELVDFVIEYKQFVGFIKELFTKLDVNDIKRDILKQCEIYNDDI